jgi:phosphocarrier protein
MQQVRMVLTNNGGLHGRPAAQFVQKAALFKCAVTVEAGGKSANAKSILQILSLGAGQGKEILVSVDGVDETECVQALSQLVQGGFSV